MTLSHGTESAIVEPNTKEQWLSSIYVLLLLLLLLLLLFIYLLIFFLVNFSPHHLASSKVDFVPCNQKCAKGTLKGLVLGTCPFVFVPWCTVHVTSSYVQICISKSRSKPKSDTPCARTEDLWYQGKRSLGLFLKPPKVV